MPSLSYRGWRLLSLNLGKQHDTIAWGCIDIDVLLTLNRSANVLAIRPIETGMLSPTYENAVREDIAGQWDVDWECGRIWREKTIKYECLFALPISMLNKHFKMVLAHVTIHEGQQEIHVGSAKSVVFGRPRVSAGRQASHRNAYIYCR